LSQGRPGLLGAVTARGEAQSVRLASLYAVLDLSLEIKIEHLKAALELWKFCEGSARHIFGDKTGNVIADEILDELRSRSSSMTRTEISRLFKGHKRASELIQALDLLRSFGLAKPEKQKTGGRNAEEWVAV